METVVAITFGRPKEAYEALTKLKELDQQGQLGLYEGGVVERDVTGRLVVEDQVDGSNDDVGIATASGGLIGLLIGVLAGPVGMLLGGSIGLMSGSIVDLTAYDDDDSVLSAFSRHVGPGETAVLAQLDEQSYEVVDSAMARLSGSVLRRLADEVRAELAAAEDARKKAEHEARKKLRQERHKQREDDIDAKLDSLRAKFHHNGAKAHETVGTKTPH
jgi:uncharacterized membrane protein